MPTQIVADSDYAQSLWQDNRDKDVYKQAVSYAFDYLDSAGDRHVFPTPEAIANLALFDEPMPSYPQDGTDILEQLHRYGSAATVTHAGGRYFGFVNGGVIPTALAARWLADAWDQNAALYVISPIASKLEQLCERWLVELLGLPADSAAGFVTGTSTATLCGMLVGRNTLLKKLGWDVVEQGLFGAPRLRVLMSPQAHATVRKALAVLGIGKESIEWLECDAESRIQVDKMPEIDANTLLLLQAGNVNSGAFDYFEPICRMAREKGAWVHIDGAFGLWAAASQATKHLTHGIELADSWSVDAHKTLNAPYDGGVVLCRDRAALVSALQASGDYVVFSEHRDGMLYGLEMSRRARGIELWALLKNLGRSGIDAMVAQLCQHAQTFAKGLTEHQFTIPNEVVFNQVLVQCETSELTQQTLKNIQESGECWCGGSMWHGKPVIRISVCSWATTDDDVQRSIRAFVAARAKAREMLS
jgi:glutamate/tyrosine decarboxylase-like PLP-dependent enzyme